MIITLVKANFSANNIGTLDSFAVLTNILNATYSGPISVEKGEAFTATITMHDGYLLDSINISMDGNILSDVYTEADGVITINISSVSGIILISASGVADDTNGDDSTSYTFTINPTPASATVSLSASGYSTVSGTGSKSITVADGTTVNWTVSASGYTARTGNWTINGGNKTENITLTATELTSHTVTSDMIVQGGWGYYDPITPVAANRLRTEELILIPSGSTVTWNIPSNLKCTISLLKEDGSTTDMKSFVYRNLWATGKGSYTTSEAAYLHLVWALATAETELQVSDWSGTYTY